MSYPNRHAPKEALESPHDLISVSEQQRGFSDCSVCEERCAADKCIAGSHLMGHFTLIRENVN